MKRNNARLKAIERRAFPVGNDLPPLKVTISIVEAVHDKDGKQIGLRSIIKRTEVIKIKGRGQ
jgi:hypothetical protein